MKQEIAKHFTDKFPDVLKFIGDYLKGSFKDNAKEIFESASGTTGIIVKLLSKPLVDKYYEKQSKKKLEDDGTKVYFDACYEQVENSIKVIGDKIAERSLTLEEVSTKLQNSFDKQIENLDTKNLISIFHPKSHPVAQFVKNSYEQMLVDLGITGDTIDEFIKDFNENIEKTIETKFGNDYSKHLKIIKENIIEEKEYAFLEKMKNLGKIGFTDTENLEYMPTYAQWINIENFKKDYDVDDENKLKLIINLIAQYFTPKEHNYFKKILFIISDFGKGKSVFMRHYASELAINYLKRGDGPFPVYFNLKQYKEYSTAHKLGILADYLADCGINVENENFKRKEVYFLVDSLDECGELTSENINKVIEQIKLIQHLDKQLCTRNRIIVTSRPIDEGLEANIRINEPFEKANTENKKRREFYFLSIYGFKQQQFSSWLFKTIYSDVNITADKFKKFLKDIIASIKKNEKIDLFKKFVDNNILSPSELRRPIFAYMIYKLILNKIDFTKFGKIGIYLSFINLLTKDAKHIDDLTYEVNVNEELKFRNILHSTAALWQFERVRGKSLTKSNICRTIEGKNMEENDSIVLNKYREIKDFKFFSHSYFGEEGNVLHFHHQSFAEILLAEYYLKIFIKYAIDKPRKPEDAQIRFMIGLPTNQTIEFLIQLLDLLKESAHNEGNVGIFEKRKLLFPLMASLGTVEYCKDLYSNKIGIWYEKNRKNVNSLVEPPNDSLINWCISREDIDKIIDLSKDILESENKYLLNKAVSFTSLYDYEVIKPEGKIEFSQTNVDKWLALLVGNILYNAENQFFNSQIKNIKIFFDLIKDWKYFNLGILPFWSWNLFCGINMENNESFLDYSRLDYVRINFSNSHLKNLNLSFSVFNLASFDNVVFENVDITYSEILNTNFNSIIFKKGALRMEMCSVAQGVFVPYNLCEVIFHKYGVNSLLSNYGKDECCIYPHEGFGNNYVLKGIRNISYTLKGVINLLLKDKLVSKDDIKEWFEFPEDKWKTIFLNELFAKDTK